MIRATTFLALAAVTGLAFAPVQGQAAHAGAPYTNVDKRVDAGNDTGDSQVDRLNSQQLDQNYKGPVTMVPSTAPPVMVPQNSVNGDPAIRGRFLPRMRRPVLQEFLTMKTVLVTALIALVLGFIAQPSSGVAANANAPQTNVDHTNDAGNDTGNSKVDTLNNGQLDTNQKPAATTATPKP